jgi:hypothetical protein
MIDVTARMAQKIQNHPGWQDEMMKFSGQSHGLTAKDRLIVRAAQDRMMTDLDAIRLASAARWAP